MAQEYLKEFIRLTKNENLGEPPSVQYYRSPNQYHLNVPPKVTYEPSLMEAETHRFQTTTYQQPPPPTKVKRVVATAVTRPYKPSPSPSFESMIPNHYDHEESYAQEEQAPRHVGKDNGAESSRNYHVSWNYPPNDRKYNNASPTQHNSATVNKGKGRNYYYDSD